MKVRATVSTPIKRSFVVDKVAGLFDLTLEEVSSETFEVDVPSASDDWQIGAIVGPSGSGKSTIAKQAFGDHIYSGVDWPTDKAVVDCFGRVDIMHVTKMFTSVGFSSPPSWVKPYHVLSTGEQFRCDLVRGLLAQQDVCVFDEYTSVVDRTVAKVCSLSLSKRLRRDGGRFVAVTCHYDIVEWLTPDWVLDMGTQQLARGCLQRRPHLRLTIYRCHRKAWRLFARHHYLTHALPVAARLYVAFLDDRIPVGCIAMIHQVTTRKWWRISRVVVLPDYQGIGVGMTMTNCLARVYSDDSVVSITTSHPGMIAYFDRSRVWKLRSVTKTGYRGSGMRANSRTTSQARSRVSFVYVGDAE